MDLLLVVDILHILIVLSFLLKLDMVPLPDNDEKAGYLPLLLGKNRGTKTISNKTNNESVAASFFSLLAGNILNVPTISYVLRLTLFFSVSATVYATCFCISL